MTGHIPHTCSNLEHLESLNITGNQILGMRGPCMTTTHLWQNNLTVAPFPPGSQWRFPTARMRYLEAKGNPGAPANLTCPESFHSIQAFEPVFPSGSRYFCSLKPGYPAAPSSLGAVQQSVEGLCFAWAELQLPTLNWADLCSLPASALTLRTLEEPQWVGVHEHMGHLVGLRLTGLGYHGPFPPAVAALTMLVELDLSQNFLTGQLPPSLCKMKQLRHLVIKYTHVTGQLPDCLGDLQYLTHLDISRNGVGRVGGLKGEYTLEVS